MRRIMLMLAFVGCGGAPLAELPPACPQTPSVVWRCQRDMTFARCFDGKAQGSPQVTGCSAEWSLDTDLHGWAVCVEACP